VKFKKYIGATLKEAMDQMKYELGENALIVGTRKVNQGGVFSFLKKDLLEITAGIEEDVIENVPNAGSESAQSFDAYLLSRLASEERTTEQFQPPPLSKPLQANGKNDAPLPMEKTKENDFRIRNNRNIASSPTVADYHSLKGELEDVKFTLREIVDQLKYSKMPSLPDQLRKTFVTLVGQDVSEQIAAHIVQTVYGQLSGEQLENKELVEQRLIAEMTKLIATSGGAEQKLNRTKIVIFVGPTGVGKTTTIAKLAAINKLFNGLNVALISADTYRIGAIEQLKTFAAIANIEMDVVYRPGEMQKAIKKHRGKDVVFIDTFGRGQREAKGLSQLRKFLDIAEPDEVHLVLSAAANEKTQIDICERFDLTKPNRLVFSKIDECVTFGSILNTAYKTGIPISYITIGQTVPEDIITADAKKIAMMIYRGVIYDV
jgi:flagellar biosynthesis protein FlhF